MQHDKRPAGLLSVTALLLFFSFSSVFAQGVTTAAMSGLVFDADGQELPGSNVVAVHEPSGTQYGVATRSGGVYNIPNMRIGGPYSVTVSFIGFDQVTERDIYLSLGQNLRLDFALNESAVGLDELVVTAEQDDVLNADRTGAKTVISGDQVRVLPSIKRTIRDLTRVDPRSDGNFSFAGRNWLFNNVSLDGSYFNNSFGLDDPGVGGQAGAQPVPFDAIDQVQVSIAPFDVREGGFTGAGINTVTKSGTNRFRGSIYTYFRNESLIGNSVDGQEIDANPDLSFNQSGISLGGPIIKNKLFFFVNVEMERRDDPGSDFLARSGGDRVFGESRVDAATLQAISDRMLDAYGYVTGPFDRYIHETNNDKLIAKIDWNINANNNLTVRYNYLDAERDLPPNATVLSFANTGRGPNENSLPSQNSGYQINNQLHSGAFELNSRGSKFSNRFFASFNQFRDFRDPFSAPFPTIEIGEAGLTYTTVGHEPFSIHNILDQDVLQITNNFSYFVGSHVLTAGVNYESFKFFNSFNIFRHGLFQLPDFLDFLCGTTFSSLDDFFARTDPNGDNFYDFNACVTPDTVPFKGEKIAVNQLGVYVQDEFIVSPTLNLTFGVRVDIPTYLTEPVDNPFSRGLTALDEDGLPETVDQSDLPGPTPMLSPRIGFNWDASGGDRTTQLRGGTGVFTGRVPFVWIGNVISNPGENPNLYPHIDTVPEDHKTSDDSILQASFDVNAFDPDFVWPQVWTTDFAIDQALNSSTVFTIEVIYGKDLNAIFMRNADLVAPKRTLAQDGRPFYGNIGDGAGDNELNPDGGAGIYVIDNTDEGWNFNITAQLRKRFYFGLNTSVAYSYTEARNNLKSTEIASVLWQGQPNQGNPNQPGLSYSEFGQRHRITGVADYRVNWSPSMATSFGLFVEVAEGNQFTISGGNRYSFIYSGDVNGDGVSGNDLIYVPIDQNDIRLVPVVDGSGAVVKTVAQQWTDLDAFIEQDDYLNANRGAITERFGALNPWYTNIDLRILQDFIVNTGGQRHTLQLSFDIENLPNLINSGWGVRKVANSAALSPLTMVGFDDDAQPVYNFTGPASTYINDPGLFSRWRAQLGVRYIFN